MTGPQSVMVTILYVFGLGVFLRKRTALHVMLMAAAIAADLGLTCYLEVSRAVIEVSVDSNSAFRGNRALLLVHIVLAVSLLATYPFLALTGWRMLHNKAAPVVVARARRSHGLLACSAFTLYFLSFLTAPNSVIERFFL